MKKTARLLAILLALILTLPLLASCASGAPGEPGEPGKSAYEIALEHGFEGSEEEWLAFLKGDRGEKGDKGDPGEKGADGKDGIKGENGTPGEKGDDGEDGTDGVGILKAEIIDGCLWITYTNAPDDPINAGRVVTEQENSVDVVDMTGYVYKAYTKGEASSNPQYVVDDFWAEESDVDTLSRSVYERNRKIQDTYHCTIVNKPSSLNDTYYEMYSFFNNNEKYEVAILGAYDLANCAASGFLRDMNTVTVEGFDLTNEAYDANSVDQLLMKNKLYYVSGAMNNSTMDNAPVNVFNVSLFKENKEKFVEEFGADYSNLYQMVADGTWTLDAMMNMASLVNNDANPKDGDLSYDKGDTLGYFAYSADPIYYWYGCDMRISKNESGSPVIDGVINCEGADAVYDKLFTLFNKPQKNPSLTYGAADVRDASFSSGAVLFTTYSLNHLRHQLRNDSEVLYGILPIAKYTEGQDGYRTVVHYQNNLTHLWALPKVCSNKEFSALMLQVMAVYSDQEGSTMDAYYANILHQNDTGYGSRVSLNITGKSLVYDYALLYDSEWGALSSKLRGILSTQTEGGDFSTFTNEGNMEAINERMEQTLNQFLD